MSDPGRLLQEAVALHQSGDAAGAEAVYRRVLALQPGEPNALHLLGLLLCERGETEAGLAAIDTVLAAHPRLAALQFNRANILGRLKRHDAALAGFDAALAAQPDMVAAHQGRARMLLALNRAAEARLACDLGLLFGPSDLRLLTLRGDALAELLQPEAALASYDQALMIAPNDPVALSQRAGLMLDLHQAEAAMAGFEAAIALSPGSADALYNRACALQTLGDPQAAIECYTGVLAVDPGHGPARWNRQMCQLLLGDFSDWPRIWGATLHPSPRSFDMPRWDRVSSLAGKSILVHVDQGFGDTLQFCRFGPMLAALGPKVVLEVPDQLTRLLATLPPGCEILAQGDPIPPVDCHANLMDLPGILGVTVQTIPAEIPYLRADPAAVAAWRGRLEGYPGRKIGVVWGGNPRLDQKANAQMDRRRSLNLAALAPLAELPGVRLVSLQKGPPAEQVRATQLPGLLDWTAELHDFADTAALAAALDLVISVDTSVVHLAGALGVPVWLLNRVDTCWRWLLDRADSPWYPSLVQFRQTRQGDWDEVIGRVRIALAALAV